MPAIATATGTAPMRIFANTPFPLCLQLQSQRSEVDEAEVKCSASSSSDWHSGMGKALSYIVNPKRVINDNNKIPAAALHCLQSHYLWRIATASSSALLMPSFANIDAPSHIGNMYQSTERSLSKRLSNGGQKHGLRLAIGQHQLTILQELPEIGNPATVLRLR
nr:hypothetical protein Iba_chr02fCG3240 [Ipomoea batatas]